MLSTHEVRVFNTGFVVENVPPSEAVLLHNRYTNQIGKNTSAVNLFPFGTAKSENIQKAMLNRTRAIFPNGASFHYETQQRLGICLQRWRETQNSCKIPISGCKDMLMPLEDWYFSEAVDEFHPL
ncbi:hypothetical protein COOONC_01573 [Cooperia oncophora]